MFKRLRRRVARAYHRVVCARQASEGVLLESLCLFEGKLAEKSAKGEGLKLAEKSAKDKTPEESSRDSGKTLEEHASDLREAYNAAYPHEVKHSFGQRLKRVFVGMLAGTVVWTGVGLGAAAAYADDTDNSASSGGNNSAMAMIRSFNSLAGGVDVDLSKQDLDPQLYKFFGIMLSNYYMPFVTDVLSNPSDKDSYGSKLFYDDAMEALTKKSLKLPEKTAKRIIEGVMSSIQKDSKELHFAYCKSTGFKVTQDMLTSTSKPNPSALKKGECVLDSGGEEPVTWFSLLTAATGGIPANVLKGYLSTDDTTVKNRTGSIMAKAVGDKVVAPRNNNDTRPGANKLPASLPRDYNIYDESTYNANTVVAYAQGENGKNTPVFVADMYGRQMTPSVASLVTLLKNSDLKHGYGASMINIQEGTQKKNKENAKKLNSAKLTESLKNYTKSGEADLSGFLNFSAKLMVSPFGDIWQNSTGSQQIIIPAAANPNIVMPVNDKGADDDSVYSQGIFAVNRFQILAQSETDGRKNGVAIKNDDTQSKNSSCGKVGDKIKCFAMSTVVDLYEELPDGEPKDKAMGLKSPGDGAGIWPTSGLIDDYGIMQVDGAWGSQGMPGYAFREGALVRGTDIEGFDGNRNGWDAWQLWEDKEDRQSGQQKQIMEAARKFVSKYKTNMSWIYELAYPTSTTNGGNGKATAVVIPWFRYIKEKNNSGNIGQAGDLWGYEDYVKFVNVPIGNKAWGYVSARFDQNKQHPVYNNIFVVDDVGKGIGVDQKLNAASDEDVAENTDDQGNVTTDSSTKDDGVVQFNNTTFCPITVLTDGIGKCEGDNTFEDKDKEGAAAVLSGNLGNDTATAGQMQTVTPNEKVTASMYQTYLLATAPSDKDLETMRANMGYRFFTEAFPETKTFDSWDTISGDGSLADVDDGINRDIRNWLWYMLNPTTGFRYKMTWLSGALSSVFIGWHNDMVGASGVGVMPGTTKYTGFNGYVSTPNLEDMEWTQQIVDWYKDHLLLIIVFVFIMLALMVVTNTITIQKALLTLLTFGVLSACVVPAVNSTSAFANALTDRIYSSKFMYWAITQQQAYTTGVEQSAAQGDLTGYMRQIYGMSKDNAQGGGGASNAGGNRGGGIETEDGNTSFDYNSQGDNNILLKWQAPKKLSNAMSSNKEKDGSTYGLTGAWAALFTSIGDQGSSAQIFNPDNSNYHYRAYTDLGNYSKYIYAALNGKNSTAKAQAPYVTQPDTSWWTNDKLKTAYTNKDTTWSQDLQNDYTNSGGNTNTPARYTIPFGSNIYMHGVTDNPDPNNVKTTTTVGIPQYCGDMNLPMFNQYGSDGHSSFTSEKNLQSCTAKYSATDADYGSLAAYMLASESPYFYATWALYDQGLSMADNASGGYKKLILPEGGTGYFYSKNNGELKDFLDMRGMFTYVMPYLRMGNKVATDYLTTYGHEPYEGISSEEGMENQYKSNPDALRKYYHNRNIMRAYMIYSPWVALLDEAGYSNSVNTKVNGKSYTISNPTDPGTYPAERPMVFSKAEQVDYGIKDAQLTKVEKKIQEVQKDTMEQMTDLLNYYNYYDSVLNTAASMFFTFNFNRVFSESKPMDVTGDQVRLYPQNFELKNFTYDAFLRMIINTSAPNQTLSGTTQVSNGVGATKNTDNTGAGFYAQTLQNSSLTVAIGYILLDLLAIYIVPALKSFFIVAIFLMLIVLLLATVFRAEDSGWSKFMKTTMKPLCVFFGITVAMSLVVSWFIASAKTNITGESSNEFVIRLGDPALVVMVMILINAIVALAYTKLAVRLGKDLFAESKGTALAIGGMVGGFGKALAAGFQSAFRGKGFKSGLQSGYQSGNASAQSKMSAAADSTVRGAKGAATATGREAVILTKKAAKTARKAATAPVNAARKRAGIPTQSSESGNSGGFGSPMKRKDKPSGGGFEVE